ncbi:MAG: glycosyltransferase N-terminal domain-containing protein [Paracoccaceae bacterium]
MGFSPSLALYHFLGPVLARGDAAAAPDDGAPLRPKGRLIWLHAPRQDDTGVILDLINNLADADADLWFLLTPQDGFADDPPEQCFVANLPLDTRPAMADFLEHWKPDIMVWATGQLFPALSEQAKQRNIPMVLLDTGAAIDAARPWLLLPGLNRRTLRKYSTILSGDEATTLALISAGARSDTVQTTGVLEQGVNPLPCIDAEWSALAELMATRPVWFAAEIDLEELGSVLAAHQQTLRRSHRLLLIISPANMADADTFADALDQAGLPFARRSLDEEPTKSDPIYLADTQDELGLWFRLAPVTFIGQTLAGNSRSGPNPLDAAALGSVVLHGPKLSPHTVAFQRLMRAGASRPVAHMGELAHAVEGLLAPDRAAIMAHAGWQITTAGAEVMEQTSEILGQAMAQSKAAP